MNKPSSDAAGSPSPLTPHSPEFKMGDEIKFTSNLENIKKVSIKSVPNSGSSAIVYKVQDPTGHTFAFKYFKCVKNQKTFSSELEKRKCAAEPQSIENEVRALTHLKQFIQSGEYKEKRYILMTFVDGETINKHAVSIKTKERLAFFKESAKLAIQKLHERGVVHNDIHAGNILFTVNNEGIPIASIIDFGLSTLTNGDIKSVENSGKIEEDCAQLDYMFYLFSFQFPVE
jgi:serine/threonine protein kinase